VTSHGKRRNLMETEYDNKNMPLTSGCARELIQTLFAGEGYHTKRSEIIERVTEYHTQNGAK